jgi:ubiquitin-protein ligase
LNIVVDTEKGYSVEPIDDNIYRWKVLMFGFKPESNIAKDLKNLKSKWDYDYVEFDITFKIDLYPFYPPLVRVVRPRFQGFMMGRVRILFLFLFPFLSFSLSLFGALLLISEVYFFSLSH